MLLLDPSFLKSSTSLALGVVKRHIRGEDAKICIASAPIASALPIALLSPPEVDTWAPSFICNFTPKSFLHLKLKKSDRFFDDDQYGCLNLPYNHFS